MKSNVVRVIVLACMLLGFGSGNVQALPYSSIDLVNSSIIVGDTFTVQVFMNRDDLDEELVCFGFDVTPGLGTYFSYAGYTLGDGFDDISDTTNAFNVSGMTFPGNDAGTVLLATLSFTALAAGTDTLSVQGMLDNMFSGAYYENTGADIYSSLDLTIQPGNSAAPVPEPATMLLLGSGLLGLAGFRKKLMK